MTTTVENLSPNSTTQEQELLREAAVESESSQQRIAAIQEQYRVPLLERLLAKVFPVRGDANEPAKTKAKA